MDTKVNVGILEETRAFLVDEAELYAHTYDTLIEALRPGYEWEFGQLERTEDGVLFLYNKFYD